MGNGYNRPFCGNHWHHTPEDLRERMKWAVDDGDPIAYEAAVSAITEYHEGGE